MIWGYDAGKLFYLPLPTRVGNRAYWNFRIISEIQKLYHNVKKFLNRCNNQNITNAIKTQQIFKSCIEYFHVALLLTLAHLKYKNLRFDPRLSAFISLNVAKTLIKTFDIKAISDQQSDISAMMSVDIFIQLFITYN